MFVEVLVLTYSIQLQCFLQFVTHTVACS